MMKITAVVAIAILGLISPVGLSFCSPLRGRVQGRKVEMRGPVQGNRVQMREPVRVSSQNGRQAVWAGNTVGMDYYYSNSRAAYSRTGRGLFDEINRGFNGYRKNWDVNADWRMNRYDLKVHGNVYRADR